MGVLLEKTIAGHTVRLRHDDDFEYAFDVRLAGGRGGGGGVGITRTARGQEFRVGQRNLLVGYRPPGTVRAETDQGVDVDMIEELWIVDTRLGEEPQRIAFFDASGAGIETRIIRVPPWLYGWCPVAKADGSVQVTFTIHTPD